MLGLSGFYPKFVKKYAKLDRLIEKLLKDILEQLNLKNFQQQIII